MYVCVYHIFYIYSYLCAYNIYFGNIKCNLSFVISKNKQISDYGFKDTFMVFSVPFYQLLHFFCSWGNRKDNTAEHTLTMKTNAAVSIGMY